MPATIFHVPVTSEPRCGGSSGLIDKRAVRSDDLGLTADLELGDHLI
jgi:hypothetical protein